MVKHDLISVDSVRIPHIISMGFSDDPSVTRFGPFVRNQYIIHYVLSGYGVFNGNRVGAGQGFLITPGMQEEYSSDPNDPWSFLWIISEDSAMEYFFDRHNADAGGIFSFRNSYAFDGAVGKLKSAKTAFASQSYIAMEFLHIFNSCIETEVSATAPTAKLYLEFSLGYIKANLHLPITVSELCRATGITQPYLFRIFKESTGLSPKQYIISSKLSEAKRLLANTELSVSLVADSVGYKNVLDFSKFFSAHIGLSPTAYRTMNR